MGTKERKERERDQRRELILEAAGDIVNEEGIENLSIRKIANKIEYSSAIIYHYFRDKEDIMEHLMHKGYQKILQSFQVVRDTSACPEEKIREFSRNYINRALENPDEYKNYMLSDSPRVLEHTSVLSKGASLQRPAVGMVCQVIKELCPDSKLDDRQIELTAQVIWASIFGLIIRMIIEKDLTAIEKQELIEHHTNLVIKGLIPAGCR